MKSTFVIILLLFSTSIYGQNPPKPDGYMMEQKDNNPIVVYQWLSSGNHLSRHFNYWDSRYHFYTSGTVAVTVGTVTTTYIKLFIPSGKSGAQVTTNEWDHDAELIDNSDFNTWLLVEEGTFKALKQDHYGAQKKEFVMSGLTIPFKIHPQTGSHQNSLLNADVSVGTLVGVRKLKQDKVGFTFGVFLGFAEIGQNSSNNTSISDNSSQTMFAVNYGVGVIADIPSKKVQIGVVLGADHGFGDICKDYIYQDGLWYAVSFSFKFLDFQVPLQKGQ